MALILTVEKQLNENEISKHNLNLDGPDFDSLETFELKWQTFV